MGPVDGAEHFIYVVEHDERFRCPDCGTVPIDWDAVSENPHDLPEDQLDLVYPDPATDPETVFTAIDHAVDILALDRRFPIENGQPVCTVCGTAYDVRSGTDGPSG